MPLPQCTRIDADDRLRAGAYEHDGWRPVEVLETYTGEVRIGRATFAEMTDVIEIAMISYTEDRLHQDETVRKTLADASKAKWVMDAFNDQGRAVYVIKEGRNVLAFLSLGIADPDERYIDLLAVHPDYRGRGLAKQLIFFALGAEGGGRLRAGTQSTNVAAKKLYESLGLTVTKRQRTFHKP